MLLELAAAPRFEMVGFGDAEGCLPGGLAATEPCMHATMGPKVAPGSSARCVWLRAATRRSRSFDGPLSSSKDVTPERAGLLASLSVSSSRHTVVGWPRHVALGVG